MTENFKLFVGVLLLAAALLAPPAAVANVLAGVTGLALLGTMTTVAPILAPAPILPQVTPIVRVVPAEPAWRVFELNQGSGVVVFREVNGKLVSRFYRATVT